MMTDPISDMLTRIRNASSVRKESISMPYSKMKYALAKILEKEGYLAKVEQVTEGKFPLLQVSLQYVNKKPRITRIRRVSKPGQRVYRKSNELPRVVSDIGIAIVSTPNGLMTNKEARVRRLGGEIVCEVY